MTKINLKKGKELMYTDYSKFYDLIYSFKDYEKESKIIIDYIKKYQKSKGNTLLELGCGSGKHLFYLQNKFNCLGTDVNKGILEKAKINMKLQILDITFIQTFKEKVLHLNYVLMQ